jgi:demethylmenaquinone methyltransferase / 2-methoxy-6-polyprenyl-1,4-benzoquinol methylase
MSEEINQLFSDIHEQYDTMNHVLSLGIDKIWRKDIASEAIMDMKKYKILDIAAGTGDLSLAIYRACDKAGKDAKILGVDFNKDMLSVAKRKVKKLGLDIKFEQGDALALRFPSNSFEVVTNSFAMRDFDDLSKFVSEIHRVLKKGGKIVLSDMSKPEKGLMKYLFKIYFNIMLLEGMLVDKNAYSFLVKSIKSFDKNNLLKILKKQGFKEIKIRSLTSGSAFLITARK